MKVKIRMNNSAVRKLEKAVSTALEKTAEAVKTDVIDKGVMPFGDTVYDKFGKIIHSGGTMQNESTFVDTSESSNGKTSIVVDTPYARRLYFHPEYKFNQKNNPNARGEWFEPWITGEHKDFAQKAFNKLYKKETGV